MKRNKVFVIDTNTLISAFLLPKSTSRKAIDKAISLGRIVVSEQTLIEFSDTFVRAKFDKYIPLQLRLEIIEDFRLISTLVKPKAVITACGDPKDNKFLELAIFSNATCIITGDQDLLILHPFENIPVISAADFLNN